MATTSASKPPQSITPGSGKPVNIVVTDSKGNDVSDKYSPATVSNGATYDKNGNIMGSSHTGSGNVNTGSGPGYNNSGDWEKNWDSASGTASFTEKPSSNKKPTGGSSSSSSKPSRPSFEKFDEPFPTFSSELQKVSQYSYYFGIDAIEAKQVAINKNCCFVTRSIDLGEFSEGDYIELDASYTKDANSSIEFYIVNEGSNGQETGIVPISEKLIENEKLFTVQSPRFNIDDTEQVIVRYKGEAVSTSLEEALKNPSDYTVSYKPMAPSYLHKITTRTIKVKIIMRCYDLIDYAPVVHSIRIRKHGGGSLWQ